ncbi:glyoxylase-like metal-dependent hydrolase (beta-lactamase superfamily II) [Mycobacteroides chelonae]|nr:glyoxylase-like metal-dependent hydrolase (beta-lactamase superfamily II) [Mycobacteroides chelonae]
MKVRHLNCGTMAGAVDHCLLVELPAGELLLVDSGFGLDCVRRPELLGWTRHLIRPALRESETAVRQISALGYDPQNVRHIVVTHLDYDHTGGLADFPWATVHIHGPEYRAGAQPTTFERLRYRPAQLWSHGPRWQVNELEKGGERWFGFPAVRDLPGLPPTILVIPLAGHTRGHVGVAVDTGAGWLLHAGDSYVVPQAVSGGIAGFAGRGMNLLYGHPSLPYAQLANTNRLADLVSHHQDEVTVFCSHDKTAFANLTQAVSS